LDLFDFGRIFVKEIRRTDRAPFEITATVRTHPGKITVNAIAAKCALESADHGLRGIGRQRFVAAFTIGAKLQHGA
jgi:hypothetical protein